MKSGIIIINKPQGLTSHDVVEIARRALGIRRIGHSGTLDPIATGVLVILVGEATKLFDSFLNFDKEYIASLTLGKTTDTGDAYGKVIREFSCLHINEDMVENVLKSFQGELQQIPPMVSALKHRGQRLYTLARRGIEVKRKPRRVIISKLQLISFEAGHIEFYVKCSKGTYIRKLGEDIAKELGYGGYISKIQRLSIGPFNIKDAISVDEINESCIRSWQD